MVEIQVIGILRPQMHLSDMKLDPVVIAIPIFLLAIAIEWIFERFSKNRTYRLNDAVTNIGLGTVSQVAGAFTKIVFITIYAFFFDRFALYQFEMNWVNMIVLFVLYDHSFYWGHRAAHRINLLWGGHVVHHQSEEFNLSVALRQTSSDIIWSISFYLPLAILGFSPVQLAIISGLNLVYQFFTHTEHINKMWGWVEFVMNTPSHHRVHHARNIQYLDKNYAGVFIIWDRMYGTFIAETTKPTYGITTPINSFNPLFVNFAHYVNVAKAVKKTKSVADAVQVLFRPPGWQPAYLGGFQQPKEPSESYTKYTTKNTDWVLGYVLSQFVVLLVIGVYFLYEIKGLEGFTKLPLAVWLIASTMSFGFIFEKRKWAWLFEIARLLAFVPALLPLGSSQFLLLHQPYFSIEIAWVSISILTITLLRKQILN